MLVNNKKCYLDILSANLVVMFKAANVKMLPEVEFIDILNTLHFWGEDIISSIS